MVPRSGSVAMIFTITVLVNWASETLISKPVSVNVGSLSLTSLTRTTNSATVVNKPSLAWTKTVWSSRVSRSNALAKVTSPVVLFIVNRSAETLPTSL